MTVRDIQYSAERIQKAAEDVFGGRFQVVVSLDDFSYTGRKKDTKTCKVESNGQYALAKW